MSCTCLRHPHEVTQYFLIVRWHANVELAEDLLKQLRSHKAIVATWVSAQQLVPQLVDVLWVQSIFTQNL